MTAFFPSMTPGVPLYKDVARRMMLALAEGEWQPGEAIPAEKKLGERFSVSIGTLRKAIDELVADNMLIRHQGRGTFVATHNRDAHMFLFFNLVRHDGLKTYPHVTLMSFAQHKADKEQSARLRLDRAAQVIRFSNLLSLGGEAALVDVITLPESLFGGLTEQRLRERPNTLYNLYQTEFGMNVIRIEERLRSGAATAEHARWLGVDQGSPLLEVHRIAFSFDQLPIEFRVSYVNTEKYEYVVNGAQ